MSALVHALQLAAVTTPYTVPPALMDALQITVLVLVAAGATAVVLTREPVRQVVVLSGYGLLLAETWLHGRGRRLPVTGVVFTLAALGLADLPPFATCLGKGWIEDTGAAR